jgi:ribosomal protein S18 acetylase RimI-like enzyme
MFSVRDLARSESGVVTELVLQSDCGLLPALFGPRVRALLCDLQTAQSNPYGADNILVVVDQSRPESVLGALVGSVTSATRQTNLHAAALLFKWYGPGFLTRLSRLIRAGKTLDNLEPDDFYLSHIAVLPAHRGRGAGKTLLLAGEERARKLGARRMVLDVEEHNERARSFYERLGYRADSIIRINLGGRGAFTFLRMAVGLPHIGA